MIKIFISNTSHIQNYFISDLLNSNKYNDKTLNYQTSESVQQEYDIIITRRVQPKIFSDATIFKPLTQWKTVVPDNQQVYNNKRYFNYNYKIKLEKLIKKLEDKITAKLTEFNQRITGGSNIIDKCKIYSKIISIERYEKILKIFAEKTLIKNLMIQKIEFYNYLKYLNKI